MKTFRLVSEHRPVLHMEVMLEAVVGLHLYSPAPLALPVLDARSGRRGCSRGPALRAGMLAPATCLQQARGPRVPHAGLLRLRFAFQLRGVLAALRRAASAIRGNRLNAPEHRQLKCVPEIGRLFAYYP